jgi:hypothetical protein
MKHLSGMIQRTLAVTCLVTGSLATVSLLPEYSTGHVLASEPAGQEVKPVAEIVQGKGYQPPPPDRSSGPRRTTGGGTRGGGCEQQGEIDLTVLAPQTHIGQTASDHPTLVWYVPDEDPYELELQLYRYASDDPTDDTLEPVATFDLGESELGYMSFTLPEDQPALSPDETYRWKIILKCEPSQPSKSQIGEADLQVIPANMSLDMLAGDPVAQAEQLAEAGLWYDAIAVLSKEPVSAATAAYRNELLSSLAAMEADNPRDSASGFSERLRYLAGEPEE